MTRKELERPCVRQSTQFHSRGVKRFCSVHNSVMSYCHLRCRRRADFDLGLAAGREEIEKLRRQIERLTQAAEMLLAVCDHGGGSEQRCHICSPFREALK